MTNTVTSVVVASASAVGKVFVIGVVGFFSVSYPKKSPLLPAKSVRVVARLGFNVFALPLIYSTIAQTVSVNNIGSLWFVIVAAFGVIAISYCTATILGYLPCFKIENSADFNALRIAASFPNIIALPILILPALCEYEVVYVNFSELKEEATPGEMMKDCETRSNTIVFVYFFAWSLVFWSFGQQQLLNVANKRQPRDDPSESSSESQDTDLNENEVGRETETQNEKSDEASWLRILWKTLKETAKSPAFLAMILGFITGCITPLRDALFSTGGALRFLGGALEALGTAGQTLMTLVVAASIVPEPKPKSDEEDYSTSNNTLHSADLLDESHTMAQHPHQVVLPAESPIMSDPNAGPHTPAARLNRRASLQLIRHELSRRSSRALAIIRRSPSLKMHTWFLCSRLIVSPALVFGALVGLECGGWMEGMPDLTKLVVLMNASLPGALVIVVVLLSANVPDSASVVAGVYLSSYILSIITVAGWTSLGVLISIPNDDGISFCSR